MAKIGRNEPCPCGSGQKVKRCCGPAAAQERLERAADAILEAFMLATHFPRLRARGSGFEGWAGTVGAEPVDDALVERGVEALGEAERRRIVAAYASEEGQAWRSLVEDVGDEETAAEALLAGAVVASVAERLPLPPRRLWALGLSEGLDPGEILAAAVRPEDLWSVLESVGLDEALAELDQGLDEEDYELAWEAAIAGTAVRLSTPWHAERLAELVTRLRAQLPFDGHAQASDVVASACEAFERDAAVRERLAALLLENSLPRLDEAAAAEDAASRAA